MEGLSTFYDIHRTPRFFLVREDGRVVLPLDPAERLLVKFRVLFVPIESRKVVAHGLIIKDLAVACVDFVAQLASVFDE